MANDRHQIEQPALRDRLAFVVLAAAALLLLGSVVGLAVAFRTTNADRIADNQTLIRNECRDIARVTALATARDHLLKKQARIDVQLRTKAAIVNDNPAVAALLFQAARQDRALLHEITFLPPVRCP